MDEKCPICGSSDYDSKEPHAHCEECKIPEEGSVFEIDLEELKLTENGWYCKTCDRMLCPRCEGQPFMYHDGCPLCNERGWVHISDFKE